MHNKLMTFDVANCQLFLVLAHMVGLVLPALFVALLHASIYLNFKFIKRDII